MFAYWIETRGPLTKGSTGVELHYVKSDEENHLRARNSKGYYTPSIDWWLSLKSFNEGQRGFGNYTKTSVGNKYPELMICADRTQAIELYLTMEN